MSSNVVKANGLCRRYATALALDDVSFELAGPGLIGILGPNGAGKTTLLDILEGLSEPTSGSFELFGERASKSRYPRRRVGVVLQREFVPDQVSVGEYADLFSALLGVPRRSSLVLERAGLSARAAQRVSKLSGGEAQRLFVAAAIVHDPELVFLDEPTAELDPENKRTVGRMLRNLARERTIVMTTHDLSEANELCDTCLFLVQGRLRAAGSKQELVAQASGKSLSDAFFHFCATRVTERGDAL